MDSRSKSISDRMKLEASKAIARLAHDAVPQYLKDIYKSDLALGAEYIIPKPFD